jgi:AcrR family transcriptional regulator
VAAAAELADEVGPDQLTMAALADRLGVRQPSMYKHVASLDALRQLIAKQGMAEAGEALGRAAIGLARDDALIAMAHAWRAWARDHPGRYQLAERAPAPGEAEHQAASDRFVAVIAAVMAGYGIYGDDAIDAIRVFRSALHGFVSLEANGGFGIPVSVDRSFDRLVHALVRAMSSWSTASEPGREVPAGLPPAERRRHVGEDAVDDVGVVVDAELVRHGEQQRVGSCDRLVLLELLDQHIRLGRV